MKTSSDADMDTRSNEPSEYSVSELSQKIKRHLEDGFDVVRVRGELGKVATPPSGHIYLSLKDDKAVLDGVIWRSNARALAFKPEIGLEVIATGQLRTYAPQSKYQISIDSIAPAGEGALMAMLEKRKRKLAAQGLFSEERKRELPFLPQVIGVATSPGGAVIHDILHRLSGRFPRHVLLWPVQVQGEKCAAEVVAAVRGFNALKPGGDIPRPDIIIVARGGGSLEDLWPFNEEEIVQAVAASDIPVISAIGHESDTTLIDLAADKRAPTPTAAAEFAVPVRSELLETVEDFARRLNLANTRRLETAAERLNQSARHIRRASDILSPLMQRFDNIEGRLKRAFAHGHAIQVERFASLGARISLHALRKQLDTAVDRFDTIKTRVNRSVHTMLSDLNKKLEAHGNLLEAFSHQRVLERGFALVWEGKNLVSRAEQARAGTEVSLEFAGNNRVQATIASESSAKPKKNPASKTTKEQESLFKKS